MSQTILSVDFKLWPSLKLFPKWFDIITYIMLKAFLMKYIYFPQIVLLA